MRQVYRTSPIYADVDAENAQDANLSLGRLNRDETAPGSAIEEASCVKKALKVAVAEDESELREFFARILPHLGYEVVAIAATGEELLQLCGESPSEIIITDVELTGMSGPDTIAVIRRTCRVGVVYVAENRSEDLAAERAGDAATLAKPFRMAELPSVIQQALQLRSGLSDDQHGFNSTEVNDDGST